MKARTDCYKCRKLVYKEAEQEYLKREYAFFNDSARLMAIYAICAVLVSMIRRGRSKKYITDLFKDMCAVFSMGDLFGKEISMTDIMKLLTKDYGIDWEKVTVNIESEKHFLTGVKKPKEI